MILAEEEQEMRNLVARLERNLKRKGLKLNEENDEI